MKKLIVSIFLLNLFACSDTDSIMEDLNYEVGELGAKPVAQIDNAQITRAQLDHALAFYSSNPMVNASEGRIKVLNEMIEEQVLYNKAIESGFDKSPEYLNNQRKLLAYEYRKFIKQKAAENTKITDIDLQIYYEKNINKYTKPAMSRLAIYQQRNDIPNNSGLSLSKVKEAAEYLKIQDGFGKYALESHHSNTANREGKLPWVSNGNQLAGIPAIVLERGAELDVGEVSDPIETEKAIFLVRLMGKKEALITPLDQVRSSLRQQLVIDRKQKRLNGYVARAKKNSKIKILKQNLNAAASVNTLNDSMGPPGFPVK